MNAAVAASLALAPTIPEVNWTFSTGKHKGVRVPMLSRGVSGYDAALRWLPSTDSDIAGYTVCLRSTTMPLWEREIWVGNIHRYTLSDVSVDDVVIGVRAVDVHGNSSLISAYLPSAPPK
jgi:hypothetical protein